MTEGMHEAAVLMSVVLPASNEEGLIGPCLDAVVGSHWSREAALEVIVVANGCRDATAEVARSRTADFESRGWDLRVVERESGGKLGALNAGDEVALGAMRVYLDADVTVEPALLGELADKLDVEEPRYASGQVRIEARGSASRAYARVWRRVPFMSSGVPGCGLFAVNAAGRARWGEFPDIISDDTYARLCFGPTERHGVPAAYHWPIAEGIGNLVKVRRRQDAGVAEIERRYPELLANDDKPLFPLRQKLGIALRDPLGFLVYSGVALAVRLTPRASNGWSRSR